MLRQDESLKMEKEISSTPLVSIIIIFLNAERFIEEAIESVFAQTYNNWELLLVDDGSTDKSSNIARTYAYKFKERIRYLEHEGHANLGMSISRNLGIKFSKGKYIAILDSDDVWLPQKLEHQVGIMESNQQVAMVYGPVLFWFSWTGNKEDAELDFVTDFPTEPGELIEPPQLFSVYYPLGETHPPCLSNVMARNDSILSIGGFDESFGIIPIGLCDDLPFFSKMHLKKTIFISDQCLTKYRQHPLSAVSSVKNNQKYKHAEFFFLKWLEKFMIKQKIEDLDTWKALEKALLPHQHPIIYHFLPRIYQKIMKQMKWLIHKNWLSAAKLKRYLFANMRGRIVSNPNPICVKLIDRFPTRGVTTLYWNSIQTETVEVRVDQPNGALFARSGPCGSGTTGRWVRDGTVFYLQDVSGSTPLKLSNTLDAVKVRVYLA